MNAYYSDEFVLPLPAYHTFPLAKYARLRERLTAERVLGAGRLRVAPAASWEDLALVHGADYLHAVRHGTLPPDEQRRVGFPWSADMVERSRRSVGATVAASASALDEGVAVNLAGGTHHAFPDRGEGYCVFNDVAVAARLLLRDRGVRRIAIIDCDVHQGNGTAAIFRGDPSVFTFSMHGANNFPLRKEESDLDVTLADGTGDDEYLAALERHLPQVLGGFVPDFVFYVSGADPFHDDRFGRLALSVEGLRARDRLVFDACRASNVPVAVTMGGGYARNIDDIVEIHTNTVREAARLHDARRGSGTRA